MGLGFAAFFAIFTPVAMIVPYFGALASSIPPILYALTISPGKAVLVAIVYLAAHQLESNVIQPLVVARTVKLHPALVAIGVVAVDRLFGFLGLVVAVPILATVQILVDELWVKPMEESRREALVVEERPRERRPARRGRALSCDLERLAGALGPPTGGGATSSARGRRPPRPCARHAARLG